MTLRERTTLLGGLERRGEVKGQSELCFVRFSGDRRDGGRNGRRGIGRPDAWSSARAASEA